MIGFPLYKIQNVFQAYLTAQNPHATHTMENLTNDSIQMSATKRLEIYYDGYRLRLLEILEGDFPKLHNLMGDEAFDALGHHYIAAYPSRHFSARYFGQYLAHFLREEIAYTKQPYLAEMADFEWALGNTLDAENANIVTLDNLKAIPPEQWGELKIHFHPSLQVYSFEWDIPQLWKAIENNEKLWLPEKQREPVTWIFWRQELQSQFRSLAEPQALIIKLFQTDYPFGDICESLAKRINPKTIPAVALGFIQQCINDGFVSALSDM